MPIIDLNQLPAPDVVEELDFETILAERKATLISLYPEDQQEAVARTLTLESEPLVKLLEENAYRELIWRQRVNEAARAVMLACAAGNDLDVIGANYNTARLIITPADDSTIPPTPAVMESDTDYRLRIQQAFEGLSVAGSVNDSRLLPTGSSPLEVAAAKACAEIEKTPVSIRELWNPDTCPANLLPWLAWSFSVDRWDEKWPEATKRAVSESETLAATPKAVKAAYDLANGKYTAQDASTGRKGLVQLSSATNSESETLAATPKAVKTAYDLANGKYTAQDATTARKGLVQLSSATNSDSETLAATPKAVKAANDNANKRVPKGAGLNEYAENISDIATDLRTRGGFFNASSAKNGMPGGHTWKHYINSAHSNTQGYNTVIGIDFNGDVIGFAAVCAGVFKGWKLIHHDGYRMA